MSQRRDDRKAVSDSGDALISHTRFRVRCPEGVCTGREGEMSGRQCPPPAVQLSLRRSDCSDR